MIAMGVVLAGCQSSPDRTSGQIRNDNQIAKAVKKNLANDSTYKYADVKPQVYGGTVQLTGFVNTPDQRLRAAELAAEAKGAKHVVNHILVKPTPTGPATIRDPLARETGYLLVPTNAPASQPGTAPQQPGQSTGSTGEGTNSK